MTASQYDIDPYGNASYMKSNKKDDNSKVIGGYDNQGYWIGLDGSIQNTTI